VSRGRPSGRALALALLGGLALAPAVEAWRTGGHRRVTADAVALLPASLPDFFRAGAAAIAASAGDPDLWRNRDTPALADAVSPEHFLDLELVGGKALPERRSEYRRLLARLDLDPQRTGYLPYAIVEGAERLALAFAEHRRSPGSAELRAHCLLAAGWLAHYAADLVQPLHTTIHHDGRARPDGSSPASGIHHEVDALFDAVSADAPLAGAVPLPVDELWSAVRAELAASHALVDAVYALEPQLDAERRARAAPEVAAFARERYRAAARFVAGLFVWSWERSARLELPDGSAR
jgi:hypothetical protein